MILALVLSLIVPFVAATNSELASKPAEPRLFSAAYGFDSPFGIKEGYDFITDPLIFARFLLFATWGVRTDFHVTRELLSPHKAPFLVSREQHLRRGCALLPLGLREHGAAAERGAGRAAHRGVVRRAEQGHAEDIRHQRHGIIAL